MPKNSTQEEIEYMRNKYKNTHKVHLIISGNQNPQNNIKDFILNRLEK